MPVVNKGENVVTPGTVCYSCVKLETGECPYGNKYGASTLTFKGDHGTGTCSYYEQYPLDTWSPNPYMFASEENKMIKVSASQMREAQLNMALYKKIMAMDKKDTERLFSYWNRVFPTDYADDMVTDNNESGQWDTKDKKTPPKGKFKKKKKTGKYKDRKLEEKKDVKFYD